MKQGLLAFQYEQEKGSTGMTGLSGLMTYLELKAYAAFLLYRDLPAIGRSVAAARGRDIKRT